MNKQETPTKIQEVYKECRNLFLECPNLLRPDTLSENVQHHIRYNAFIIEEVLRDFDILMLEERWLGASMVMRLLAERVIEFGWISCSESAIMAARVALKVAQQNKKYATAALKLGKMHRDEIPVIENMRVENRELSNNIMAKYNSIKAAPNTKQMSQECSFDKDWFEWLYLVLFSQYSRAVHMNPQNFFGPADVSYDEELKTFKRTSDEIVDRNQFFYGVCICLCVYAKTVNRICNGMWDSKIMHLFERIAKAPL